MPLQRTLQTILSKTALQQANELRAIEVDFTYYFYVSNAYNSDNINYARKNSDELLKKLNDLIIKNESDAQTFHPQQEALAYLICRYGLVSSSKNQKPYLNEKAARFLKSPGMKPYVEANNRQLITLINHHINDLENKAKAVEEEKTLRQNLQQVFFPGKLSLDPIDSNSLNHWVNASLHFQSYLRDPTDEEAMERELKSLLCEFEEPMNKMGWSEYDLLRKIYVNFIYKEIDNRWPIINTLYAHYTRSGRSEFKNLIDSLRKSLIKLNPSWKYKNTPALESFINELQTCQEAYEDAAKKISTYKRFIYWAGFAFGMEIAMLALENLALMSSLGPLGVLGLIAASCMVFGILIGKFFKSGHALALEKQLRFEYFHNKLNKKPESNNKGAFIAKWGTIIEGSAATVLLLTLGAFTIDMLAWAVVGGSYTSALPGLFFASLSSSIFFVVPAVITALIVITYSVKAGFFLQKTHYSLDGIEAEEYYQKKQEDESLRSVLPTSNPSEPLIFSRPSWRQKIDDGMNSCFPALYHSKHQPI